MDDGRRPFGSPDAPTGSWHVAAFDVALRTWRNVPPVLRRAGVMLREAAPADAPALLASLTRTDVTRVTGLVPASIDSMERGLEAGRVQRLLGHEICFAVVPADRRSPVGLFRVRATEPGFGTAEWEFALAPECWGGGLFFHAAPLVVDFAFAILGAHRLEARTALHNVRGAGALRKLGAVQEAVLRQSLWNASGAGDQALWTIAADAWRSRSGRSPVH